MGLTRIPTPSLSLRVPYRKRVSLTASPRLDGAQRAKQPSENNSPIEIGYAEDVQGSALQPGDVDINRALLSDRLDRSCKIGVAQQILIVHSADGCAGHL